MNCPPLHIAQKSHGHPKGAPKRDPKGAPKGDPKGNPKGDPKEDSKGDLRHGSFLCSRFLQEKSKVQIRETLARFLGLSKGVSVEAHWKNITHGTEMFALGGHAYIPKGGNKGGRGATPTSISIFDFYETKTL